MDTTATEHDPSQHEADLSMRQVVLQALQDVKDPEIPTVSLVELGMVYEIGVESSHISIKLIPTFVGCPATQMMQQQVVDRLQKIEGIKTVDVSFVLDIPWTTDRITIEGREKLASFGIAPPAPAFSPHTPSTCSYCGSGDTEILSLFGPTACRSIFYCKTCKQPFEGMKFI